MEVLMKKNIDLEKN